MDNVSFFTMPYKGTYAWSRTYKQNLDYVVPKADELLKIVNEQLSPFAEEFALSDLDIMFTNADGSVGSTTGYVEDSKAALPPEKPVTTTPETENETGETTPEEGETPGEGEVLVDPETGTITIPGVGEAIIDPETGEMTFPETGETTDPEQGGTETEEPVVSASGEEPETGGEVTAEPEDPIIDEPDEPLEAQ